MLNGYDNLNEIFNETESLDMAGAKVQQYEGFNNNVFYPVRNEESSNYAITNYGNMIKMLLPRDMIFKGMYLDPESLFKEFNSRYNEIFQDEFQNNKTAWENVIEQINIIKNTNRYDVHQRFNTILSKCLQLDIENNLHSQNKEINKKKIKAFKTLCLTSPNENIRNVLPHIKILNSLENRIIKDEYENDKSTQQEKNTIPEIKTKQNDSKVSQSEDKMLKFANGFISAYTITEEDYQYDKRVEDEEFNIDRIQKILDTNGNDLMLLNDLEGNVKIDNSNDSQEPSYKNSYSQKQISAMARMLKAADLLTRNKQLNPDGRNYMQEFINVPNIKSVLIMMAKEGKDTNSYICKLKKQARENEKNGIMPIQKETEWEKATRLNKNMKIEDTLKLEFSENDLLAQIYEDMQINQSDLDKSFQTIQSTKNERSNEKQQSEYRF